MEIQIPEVSVIVPVFNGADYIEDCVGFLKAQTFDDFEVIISVDVKSTDGSMEKAEEITKDLPNFSVFPQTDDLHLAGARNNGLAHANGRFVWFCDVDDAPSPYLLEDCVRIQRERGSDMVCFNAVNTGPKGTVREKRRKYEVIDMDRKVALSSWIPMKIPVTAWSKYVSRDLLTRNGIVFEDSMAEDIQYTYRVIGVSEKISVYLRPLYAYRQTHGSITRSDENMDRRGKDEISSYNGVDIMEMDPAVREKVLRSNAVMKMRSSGHMGKKAFLEYAKGPEFRKMYDSYLRGSFESWGYIHFPRTYHAGIRFYLRFFYKRNGSTYMRTKVRRN